MALPFLYDNETKYLKILEECVKTVQEGDKKYEQISIMNMPDRLRVATQVMSSPDGGRLSLVYPKQKEEEIPEEIVLRLQGYAVQLHLPPILNRKQLGKVPIQARQSITISGLGSESFNQGILAVLKIHQHFSDNCRDGEMEGWVLRKDRGHPIITAGNRYLSFGGEDSSPAPQSFEDIDPLQILRKAVPGAVHASENQVLYFERTKATRKITYQPVRPMAVRAGQLVEVQLGFSAVRTKKGRFVFLPILRSICILDRTLQDDMTKATLDQLRLDTLVGGSQKALKRRVGYEENDDAEGSMSGQLKRLCVDILDEMDITDHGVS